MGCIYLITCLINNKKYIGQTVKTAEERFYSHCKSALRLSDKRYKSRSRSMLHYSMNKYGIGNFIVETLIIVKNNNKNTLNILEQNIIKKYNSTNKEIGYNITIGGGGTSGLKGKDHPNYGKHHTKASKKKLSKRFSGRGNNMYGRRGEDAPMYGKHRSEEFKKAMSERVSGKNNPMYGMSGEKNHFYGRHHSKRSKKRISRSIQRSWNNERREEKSIESLGTFWINNGIIEIRVKNDSEIPDGYFRGRLLRLSDDSRKRISEAGKKKWTKKRKKEQGRKTKVSIAKYWNSERGIKEKKKISKRYKENWENPKYRNNMISKISGKICITNSYENRRIKGEEIPKGFWRGITQKKDLKKR